MAGDPLIGVKLGDYEIRRVLGQGGMARVYLGHDSVLQRDAAVKVVDPHFVRDDERDEYRERFLREARAIARLRHPHIVDVYQFGQAGDIYYMAMGFVAGRDLRCILKDHTAAGTLIAPADALRIVTDVADALDYAHQAGVIHRDVKPSNIMVMADGHAVLTDFGLVLNVPEGTIGTTFGSVHYIAPEQAESSRMAAPQSDLYALGVVLYEMLAGRVPFDDQSIMSVALKQINDAPPPPSLFNRSLSPAVEAMVLKTLAKEPAQRYQTGAEFVAALESALGMTDDDEITRRLPLPLRLPASPALERTPAWVVADPEAPTLVDSDTGSARRQTPPAGTRRVGRYAAGAALALLAAALGLGALLAAGSGGGAPAQAASTLTGVPAGGAVTRAALTPTVTVTATRPPAVSETAPTVTAAAVAPTVPPADVRLIYDASGLTLLNVAAESINVSDLTFVQTQAGGDALVFRASMWSRGSAPPAALPPGDCFQVWVTDQAQPEPPAACGTRHAWSRVSPLRRFWASDTPAALFRVERGGAPLAECAVAAGECAFALD
ncbi:MAG: hypothetical protein BroJett033_1200 [Chloroflexota bacterium]|nr:MAG: hypothetical protein BroJett033_1200 [Chloroflexota bacterium]